MSSAHLWIALIVAVCLPACGGLDTRDHPDYIADSMAVISRFRRDTLSASSVAELQFAYSRVVSDWAMLTAPADLRAVNDGLGAGFVRAKDELASRDPSQPAQSVNTELNREFIFPPSKDWSDAITRNYKVLVRFTQGPSMQPTFCSGDGIKFRPFDGHALRFAIVLTAPLGESGSIIKRIAALPSETVEVRDGSIYVDSARLDDPYAAEPPAYRMKAVTLKSDEFFLLGDNPNDSHDSHDPDLGPVRSNQVEGIADGSAKGTCPAPSERSTGIRSRS